ncbi:MAG: ABC transporter substrate-binding protein, partial [Anaerolineaceae bacterium]
DEMGRIIGQITTNWDFNVAKTLAESNLTATTAADKGTVFILAPNDGTARAIADAFAADTDVEKYYVTGQDAEIASVQYIIDGKQSMTVLKDVRTLVSDAIKAAVAFLEGSTPEETTTYNNGVIDVPAKPSAVVSVDQANVKEAVIDSGYYTADQFTGLDATVSTEEPEAELGPVLKIGQIGMMSGSMALYGLQQQRGFEMGLKYMSGGKTDDQGRYIIANRPVEVIVKDDEGNAEKAVSLALELIEKDGVELLQGPVSSASAIALTNVALENKIILMIDPAASYFTTGAYFNPYVFRTARTSFDDTLIIAKYLVENVGPTFAHIGIDNAFGQASGAALKYSVEKFGGELIADIYAPFETTDFTPYIQQAMDSGAENLFLTWSGTGYVTLFQGLADMGALDVMTVGTGYGDNASFSAVFGPATLNGIGLNVYHYTVPDNPVNDWLVENHFETYKDEPDAAINAYPDLFTAGGMASAIALATALEKTGGDTSGDAMIAALEGLTFEGPKGTYHIRPEDHVCEQPMNILKLVNLNPDLDGDGINEYHFFETIYVSEYDELGVPCTLEGEYASRCGDLPVLTAAE